MVTIPGYTQLVITGTAESHNSFFISKLQNPNPFRIRFLLRKLLDAAAGVWTQPPESGSKKSSPCTPLVHSPFLVYVRHCLNHTTVFLALQRPRQPT